MISIIIAILYFILPTILFANICKNLYFDKEKITSKSRKVKLVLTNLALIIYAVGMLTPLSTIVCLCVAYMMMIVVYLWNLPQKERGKAIITIVVMVIVALVIFVPVYKNHVAVTAYEDKLNSSIESAVVHYEAYEESGEVNELEGIADDLYEYHMVLLQLEDLKKLPKNSAEVIAAVNVLEAKRDDVEAVQDLKEALYFLQEDIYSDAGYSMLLSFVNKNSH